MWNWQEISRFFWTPANYKSVTGVNQFEYFDSTHLTWLAIFAAVLVFCVVLFRRLAPAGRTRMFQILTIILVLDELLKYTLTGLTGQFQVQFLPFHLCSINLFVCLWYTLRPNEVAANILYCLSMPAALISLIMPAWTGAPMWNLMEWHSESVHMLLFIFPLLLLIDGFRPRVQVLPKVALFLLVACIPGIILNHFFDTNFMFLNHTDNNPLLELFAGWFGDSLYVIGLPFTLAAVWALMYLPWILQSRRRPRLYSRKYK